MSRGRPTFTDSRRATPSPSTSKLSFYCLLQVLEPERHIVNDAVDEERGGGAHPAPDPAVDMLVHALQIDMVLHFVVVALQIELCLFRISPHVPGLQMQLVLEQQIMHAPELSLCAGLFRRFRRELGMRVNFPQREIAEHEAQ